MSEENKIFRISLLSFLYLFLFASPEATVQDYKALFTYARKRAYSSLLLCDFER
jgi:hypothetical protein